MRWNWSMAAETFFLEGEFSSLRWTRIRLVGLQVRSNWQNLQCQSASSFYIELWHSHHRAYWSRMTTSAPPSTPQEESPQIDQERYRFFDGFDSVSTCIPL